MRLVHRRGGEEREVHVEIDDETSTLRDLLVAAGDPPPGSSASLDGASVSVDRPLSSLTLCEGSEIRAIPEPVVAPSPRTLAVVGGVRAGPAVGVDDRTVVFGRGPLADLGVDDPTVAVRQGSLRAGVLREHGSVNRVTVEGCPLSGPTRLPDAAVIRAGTSRFALRTTLDDRPAAFARSGPGHGTLPFNRPPRAAPPGPPPPMPAPAPTPGPEPDDPLSIAGIVLPMVAGVVVAVLWSPTMLVFAALGPLLTVGTWWERRRRRRRAQRAAQLAAERALDEFRRLLPAARRGEILRRRSLHPDPAEVVRRASAPSVRCWERRADDPDAFRVAVGAADEPFRPALATVSGDPPAEEAVAALAAVPLLPDVPVEVHLGPGSAVGVLGHRPAALAVVRCLLLQMAVHHGPADLAVAIVADRLDPWRWAGWLPHTRDPVGGRTGATLAATDESTAAESILAAAADRLLLVVIDGADPVRDRTTVGRRLLAGASTASVVVTEHPDALPAGCGTVVRVDELGRIDVGDPRRSGPGHAALAWGVEESTATSAARRLARLDDPELPRAGAGVPERVDLGRLLALPDPDAGGVESRWRRTDGTAELTVPIGMAGDGPLVLDLVADGPHVLIGGTTGSGKSELLRSLVAGIAATADPDHVAFVLVDYKGGAAFDRCADLPHVAGLVTDLDDRLAARALQCLEAELRHRERRLRSRGADDLAHLRRLGDEGDDPLPRLVVVVDEFATLAADLPDFLDALVGIAQRGRSLGVHLVLATQRPAGVVTDDIRANAGCRIALRVTDRGDSTDVIGTPEAATLPRSRPGRAVARLGPGELVTFQSALVTAASAHRPPVRVRPVTDAAPSRLAPATGESGSSERTDLERLVAAVGEAHRRRGGRTPRTPWPPPLPARIVRDDDEARAVAADAGAWWLIDDPEAQRRRVGGWTPIDGHLVVVGGPGAGATTALVGAALAAVRTAPASGRHVHGLDLDDGGLLVLAEVPGVGTLVGPAETERALRLLRWLDDEVARRRSCAGTGGLAGPEIVVLVDDLGGLARRFDPVRRAEPHECLQRVWADGPAVGIRLAVSLRRGADLAPALAATVGETLLLRTTDAGDAHRFGRVGPGDEAPPGRAVRAGDGALLQIVLDGVTPAEAAGNHLDLPPPPVPPHVVGDLPPRIGADRPGVGVARTGDRVVLTVAVRDRDLAPAGWTLHPGDHLLVLGPARSGRTATLATIAALAPGSTVVVGPGPLADRVGVPVVGPSELAGVLALQGPTLVLVDDCLAVDDPSGTMADLVRRPPPGVHLVVSARAERYRAAYGHWSAEIRSSRTGLLLRPDPLDGDLLGQPLPPRLELPGLPGRGVVVADGTTEVVQVVLAAGADQPPSAS